MQLASAALDRVQKGQFGLCSRPVLDQLYPLGFQPEASQGPSSQAPPQDTGAMRPPFFSSWAPLRAISSRASSPWCRSSEARRRLGAGDGASRLAVGLHTQGISSYPSSAAARRISM